VLTSAFSLTEKLLPIVANLLDQPASTIPFATTRAGHHPAKRGDEF